VDIAVNEPKTKRGFNTRNKILKAAERTFGEKGYYGTSINDIATRAKVAPGTLYIYFKDKFTLYCYLLNQYNHLFRSEIAKKITESECKTRRDGERIGLLRFLEIIQKHPHIYNIIWESLYIDKKLFVDYYKTFAEHYKKNLDSAFRRGEIGEYDNELLAYLMMGIANFIGLRYVIFGKNTNLEEVVDEAMKVLDNGLFI
jgi:AcrR family transcriptional regulator